MLNRLNTKFLKLITVVILLTLQTPVFGGTQEVRVGHFPSVTHAPALIARARGHFESELGRGVGVQWKTFNAGPEAIEALFAGAIDILYVGPNPAVNGFIRSKGEALRVVAGVASGGSAFVVRTNSGIQQFEDIRRKRVASPQKGNTQDVALLYLMKQKGLVSKSQGGEVEIFNISGGDQITAFLKNQVDAIWTVEPWVSRLVAEAGGKILFEEGERWPEGKYATTLLVVRKRFLDEHPDLVQEWVRAHAGIIRWMQGHFTEAEKIFNEELKRETGQPLPPDYLEHSFGRIVFTEDLMKTQVLESAERARAVGYLGKNPIDLANLFEPSFLDSAHSAEKKEVR